MSVNIRTVLTTSTLFLSLVFLLPCSGCTNRETKENNRLREEIITVHDQAMEKIGYMYLLESQLKELKPAGAGSAEGTIKKSRELLQSANRSMFDWMHQYQTLAVDEDIARDTTYRRSQLQQIRDVQQLTDEAIQTAEKQLRKIP